MLPLAAIKIVVTVWQIISQVSGLLLPYGWLGAWIGFTEEHRAYCAIVRAAYAMIVWSERAWLCIHFMFRFQVGLLASKVLENIDNT